MFIMFVAVFRFCDFFNFLFFFNFYHNIFLLVMLHLVSVFGIGRLIFVAGDLFTILFMLILLLS